MSVALRQARIINWIKDQFESLENVSQETHDGDRPEKNILLIGRIKSGKTTLKQMIRDPTRVSDELTMLSKFSTIECEPISCLKSTLSLTIVDTKGLSGRPEDYHELLNIAEETTKLGITSFDLICYCLSFEAGIRQQDITAVKGIIDYYGEQIKPNLCMIITRCESKNEEQRARIRTEIEQDRWFRSIVKEFGQGVHFSGALNYDDWNNGSDALCDQFLTIYDYRKKLLQLFQTDVSPVRLQTLGKPTMKPTSVTLTDQSLLNREYGSREQLTNKYVSLISEFVRD